MVKDNPIERYCGVMCVVGEVISDQFIYTQKRKGEEVKHHQAYISISSIVDESGKDLSGEFDSIQIISLNEIPKIGSTVKVVGVFQQSPWMTFEEGKWYRIQDCFAHSIKIKGKSV